MPVASSIPLQVLMYSYKTTHITEDPEILFPCQHLWYWNNFS